MTNPQNQKLFSIVEARGWLLVRGFERSEQWLRNMIHNAKAINYLKLHGRVWIEESELQRVLKEQPKLKNKKGLKNETKNSNS